jgi:hypothetical protein
MAGIVAKRVVRYLRARPLRRDETSSAWRTLGAREGLQELDPKPFQCAPASPAPASTQGVDLALPSEWNKCSAGRVSRLGALNSCPPAQARPLAPRLRTSRGAFFCPHRRMSSFRGLPRSATAPRQNCGNGRLRHVEDGDVRLMRSCGTRAMGDLAERYRGWSAHRVPEHT